MDRTKTTAHASFTLPTPASATFDFIAPNQIRITIPANSTWKTKSHWHNPDQENCLLLHTEKGELHFGYHKEPRTGADVLGPGNFKFKPGYWTSWSRTPSSKKREKVVVLLVVRDEGLYRNVCSAILDAEKFPHLRTTPLWLRGVFAALKLLPTARKRLVEWMLYIQLQVIYYKYGYWEYHGGINALRWWQWTHPFDIGRHPAWTVRLQFRSQRFFSKAVQGAYYWVARSLVGMKEIIHSIILDPARAFVFRRLRPQIAIRFETRPLQPMYRKLWFASVEMAIPNVHRISMKRKQTSYASKRVN